MLKPLPAERPRPPQPRSELSLSLHRCPFCHDDAAPEHCVVCQNCLARHHQGCWEEGRGCSACSSKQVLVPREAPGDTPTAELTPPSSRPRPRHTSTLQVFLAVALVILLVTGVVLASDFLEGIQIQAQK